MNIQKVPKPPTLLLLLLMAVSCGLLLIHTVNEDVANGGFSAVQDSYAAEQEAYQMIP